MNIVKLQNQLKSIPVETLIKYVQGANPEVPSYLALAEIKNRKDMEERYTAQKAPQSSVLEDLTQGQALSSGQVDMLMKEIYKKRLEEAQPGGVAMLAKNPQLSQGAPTSQGVADLPVPDDMYQDQNFAAGGIVAFTEGGPADLRYQAWQEDSYFQPGLLYAGAKDLLGMPFQYGWTRDPVTGKLVRKKDVEGFTPSLDEYRKASELRKKGLIAEAEVLEKAAKSPKVDKKGLASIDTSAAEPGMTFSRDELANIYQNTIPTSKTRPSVVPEAPPADVTRPAPGPAVAPKDAGIEGLLEDTSGLAEKRMERYRKMVGEDPERANLEKLVKKYETGATEQERMAPWMALAKAGFTMAGGKSPFAIQNLSEGAVAGLSDYAQAKDRLDKLNEKQIDIRTKMQQARRAEDIAAATYGLNSEATVEARNAQVKLKDLEEKNANLRNAASNATHIKAAQIAAAKKSDYETYIDFAKQDPDNYKMIKDKDGTVQKVFDATKVTQAFKSWSGTSSAATDKELIDKWSENKFDPKFLKQYPTPADFVIAYRQKMSGSAAGGSAPIGNRPPLEGIFKPK